MCPMSIDFLEIIFGKNAKISGDDISFTAERPFGTFTYTGKISGNEIKFKVAFNDQNFEMTAKRL